MVLTKRHVWCKEYVGDGNGHSLKKRTPKKEKALKGIVWETVPNGTSNGEINLVWSLVSARSL
jgi:hypothetical protein